MRTQLDGFCAPVRRSGVDEQKEPKSQQNGTKHLKQYRDRAAIIPVLSQFAHAAPRKLA